MGNKRLFLSHSTQDKNVVTAFVNFMFTIGLKSEDIICTSVPSTKIPNSEDIYDYLNKALNDEIYVIFFLSDNYYSSTVCLNEMGAAWLKKADSLNLLLAGFDFADIRGVVNKNKVGIKLGTCDEMSKASLNEFKDTLYDLFGITVNQNVWETARDTFLNATIDNSRYFNMLFSRSYCIGDLEHDGCKIIKKESSSNMVNVAIDFSKTDSKLSSIVFFNGRRNFTSHFINKRNLCFEAYAETGISCVDVELKLGDVDIRYEIYLNDDEKNFKIPLVQFCEYLSFWEDVPEIKFVIHRKSVTAPGKLTIKNLRIE
ncbi:toll/interleukin-1 receptor domain-containing protein [Ruminococcus sp.]|uniref:toll/interleukin-1 receptor domain-containing protein n=1 Tax=Ruminococcus sp. TaxID=41978 RepID=UPI0025E36F8A|nr:toll/interleukin-1 receptor domain-containing protein [Ruminococcus sp.]MBQ8966948.1 toll/interleukin-1 receptor domain-containing protein [Ruminococcus sp.]